MKYLKRRRLGGEVPPHLVEKARLQAEFRNKINELDKLADEILSKDTKQRQLMFQLEHSKAKRTNNYVKFLTLRKKESLKNAIS